MKTYSRQENKALIETSRVYTDIKQLGLNNSPSSAEAVVKAMDWNSIGMFDIYSKPDAFPGMGTGMLTVRKIASGHKVLLDFYDQNEWKLYWGAFRPPFSDTASNSSKWTGWQIVGNGTYEDISDRYDSALKQLPDCGVKLGSINLNFGDIADDSVPPNSMKACTFDGKSSGLSYDKTLATIENIVIDGNEYYRNDLIQGANIGIWRSDKNEIEVRAYMTGAVAKALNGKTIGIALKWITLRD